MKDNIIFVKKNNDKTAVLKFQDINCYAFFGENGVTSNKMEGDRKTPVGNFKIGLVFGFHKKSEIDLDKSLEYIQITDSMYWVCDSKSEFYNQLVDCNIVSNKWDCAEHLIDYKIQYEYAIEILSNPDNIPEKGSAIFLHCSTDKPTERLYIS